MMIEAMNDACRLGLTTTRGQELKGSCYGTWYLLRFAPDRLIVGLFSAVCSFEK
jgi:hypothetical protein